MVFATLLGAIPRPSTGGDTDAEVRAAIEAQEQAGLEPITDGRLRGSLESMELNPAAVLAGWRFAAALTDRAVKQALPGPYSLGRRSVGKNTVRAGGFRERESATLLAALAVRAAVDALADAGCPLVEIEETEAHLIDADEGERQLFRESHRRLTEGVSGTHLSLSIAGGSGWGAGLETIAAAPYASLAVDLIAGPDNWNLVTRLPGDRGVIAGALPAASSPADAKELLLWAARYAAGANGRGLDRVGLGSAGSWVTLSWEAAVEKMNRLGAAARIAATPGGEALARQLDPRSVSARTAAMGHAPARPRDADAANDGGSSGGAG